MSRLEDLIAAYTNEKATDILLKYNHVVDEFNVMLKYQIVDESETQLVKTLKELETERIKFFVKEYILIRLEKLNKNIYIEEHLLSSLESRYYRKHLNLLNEENIIVPEMPEYNYSKCEYVGFRCLKDLENVKIDGEQTKIIAGDFLVANLDDVIEYLNEGSIELV